MNTPTIPVGYVQLLPDRRIKGRHVVFDVASSSWTKPAAALRGTRVGTTIAARKINDSDLQAVTVTA